MINRRFYVGTIAYNASYLASNDPNIRLYNSRAPNRTMEKRRVPEITMLSKGDTRVQSIEVVNTSYLVRKPVYEHKRTKFKDQVAYYRQHGYSVSRVTSTGINYTLEKRVKVQDARYRVEKRSFKTRGRRNLFLTLHPNWKRGKTRSEYKNWMSTVHKWRDSKSGRGSFTGKTRQVVSTPAKYRTKRQYSHVYRVERTGTRTVTRTKSVRVPITRHRWETHCTPWGCYRSRESYTDWVTRTYTRHYSKRYTYTVRKSNTYWSFRPRRPTDDFTGRTKRVKVRSAQYKTQYLFAYRQRHSERISRYVAKHRVLIQPEKYEWRPYKSTKSERVAKVISSQPDRRIGSRTTTKEWVLARRGDTNLVWKQNYHNRSQVVKTRAGIHEVVIQEYINPKWNRVWDTKRQTRTKVLDFEGLLTEFEIRNRIRNGEL